MSEYSPEQPDSVAIPNDAGLSTDLTGATDQVPSGDEHSGLDVDFHLALGSIARNVQKLCDSQDQREQMRLAVQPNTITLAKQVPYVGGGFNTFGIADFGTPQQGRLWTVRAFAAAADGFEQGFLNTFPVLQTPNEPVVANGGGASTGALSATLQLNYGGNVNSPYHPAYVTGIDVTIGPPAAAGTTTITLANIQGGTMSWTVQQQAGQSVNFSRSFGSPGLPVVKGQTPVLSTSATASGGAANLTLTGTYSASRASVFWYVGTPPQVTGSPLGSSLPFNPTPQIRTQMMTIPDYRTVTNQSIYVKNGDHLFALVFGAMEAVDCMVTFDDQVDKAAKPGVLL